MIDIFLRPAREDLSREQPDGDVDRIPTRRTFGASSGTGQLGLISRGWVFLGHKRHRKLRIFGARLGGINFNIRCSMLSVRCSSGSLHSLERWPLSRLDFVNDTDAVKRGWREERVKCA